LHGEILVGGTSLVRGAVRPFSRSPVRKRQIFGILPSTPSPVGETGAGDPNQWGESRYAG
jgi:hypothetical protein